MTPDSTITPPGRRAFGTVFVLRNGRFQARYRRDGRDYKKSFRTERQADQFLTREQGKLNEGTWASPAARRLTFEQATALVVADYQLNDRRSGDRLEDAIEHLRGTFGGRRMASIGADAVVDYVNAHRTEGAALATI